MIVILKTVVKSNGDINPVIIYEWDGANYVDSGNKFEAAIGSPNAAICDEFTDSTDHGQFLEIRIALADIYNISNCEVCSDLKILPSTTYASGSFNSTPQDPFEANISFDVGAPMIPSQNPWCSAETLADLDATVMGAGITRWYLDNQLVNELFPPFDEIPLANRSYWVTLTLEGSTCESDPVEVVILLDTTGPTITAPADYTIYGCDETELEDTDTELSYNFGIAGGPTDALALDKAKFLLLKGGGSALPDQSDVTYLGYYDSAVDSTNPCAKTFIRTFIAFDDCNNNTTQVITITDDTAPTWDTVALALDTSLECSDAAGIAAAQALFPVASDNCDSDVIRLFTGWYLYQYLDGNGRLWKYFCCIYSSDYNY
jgi:hypothetical protein